MAAKNRFRPVSRRLLAAGLGLCVLLTLAGSRCRAQSAPAEQSTPAQPATRQSAPAPATPAPVAQSDPAKSQNNADSDDDKWPDPEWETQQNQVSAPADKAPQAQTPSAVTPASNQPAPNAQLPPVKAQPDTAATLALPATHLAPPPGPTEPRPPYPGMTPEEKRKQQVALECADLLKLATDLKAQVDKASKDELSVTVVRKASELEQLAHKVRNGTALSASDEKVPTSTGAAP